ncbi:MAG: response regulator [Spirochaetia bacterium]|nr:response regulator [Spirochaetia bacterium]MCF7953054.1 response regulator [Spirochaetales bacterium]
MDTMVIVDDEEWVRYFIAHALDWKKFGLRIAGQAEDGKTGLAMCRLHKPALLITDIRMPGLDGTALFTKILSEQPETKVIVLSGYDDFPYVQKAVREHVFDYLLKPVSQKKLEETIVQALHEYRERRAEKEKQELLKKETEKLKLAAAGGSDEEENPDAFKQYHPAAARALQILHRAYGEPITLADVADRVYVSPQYLSALFKEETGMNFSDYLTELRMRAAKRLLEKQVFKVHEISRMVGYTDSNYFSKVFKRIIGVSPGAYKDQTL